MKSIIIITKYRGYKNIAQNHSLQEDVQIGLSWVLGTSPVLDDVTC